LVPVDLPCNDLPSVVFGKDRNLDDLVITALAQKNQPHVGAGGEIQRALMANRITVEPFISKDGREVVFNGFVCLE
jgi:hypothetical protein